MWCLAGQRLAAAGTLPLSSLTGANGFKLDGENNNDYSGLSVSTAGDINGDGYSGSADWSTPMSYSPCHQIQVKVVAMWCLAALEWVAVEMFH